jgi:hypothetical protein
MEQFLIKQIENAIRGIKLGNKTPQEVAKRCNGHLDRLQVLNSGMAEELAAKFVTQCKVHNSKSKKTH